MKILYHMTNLPPKVPGTEASLQELDTLRNHFGGELVFINPNQRSPIYLPRLLFGFQMLKQLRAKENNFQAHHIYNADPFPFPILRQLKKPVIYSISSGVGDKRPNISFFNSLAGVIVSDERSLNKLQTWGLKNAHLVHPGIDLAPFAHNPLPLTSEFRLMVGSAPWMKSQFKSKGIDDLLKTAQQIPNLHLVCLWRGVLLEEMEHRVQQMGLKNQVEIINQKVDVNQILGTAHAAINLVTNPVIIRAYPHSLLEALAAGKPIIASRSLPISDYIEQNQCGTVVDSVTASDISASIESLIQNYSMYQQTAQQMGRRDFSEEVLITSFQDVYQRILNSTTIGG